MEKIIIGYSRHDLLKDKYSEDYKYKARKLIDSVAEAIEKIEDSCIKNIYAVIEEQRWLEDDELTPVYMINFNDDFLLSFKIEDFIKADNVDRLAYRLNKIIENKYKEKQ